jgi:hypothetical protein
MPQYSHSMSCHHVPSCLHPAFAHCSKPSAVFSLTRFRSRLFSHLLSQYVSSCLLCVTRLPLSNPKLLCVTRLFTAPLSFPLWLRSLWENDVLTLTFLQTLSITFPHPETSQHVFPRRGLYVRQYPTSRHETERHPAAQLRVPLFCNATPTRHATEPLPFAFVSSLFFPPPEPASAPQGQQPDTHPARPSTPSGSLRRYDCPQ